MILSILIPTLTKRKHLLEKLLSTIRASEDVEILINEDRGEKTTGQKRNELKALAKGEYIIYLDDDDEPAEFYIRELLEGAKSKPDCIVFNGYVTTNGRHKTNFKIRLGEKYEVRGGVYYRYPNHICAIKRELVKDVDFPTKTRGEDYEWATKIKDSGLLKTQYVIEKDMYHYKFITNK